MLAVFTIWRGRCNAPGILIAEEIRLAPEVQRTGIFLRSSDFRLSACSFPLATRSPWLAARGSQLVARGSPLTACSLQLAAFLCAFFVLSPALKSGQVVVRLFSRKGAKAQRRKESFSRQGAKSPRKFRMKKIFLTTEDTEVSQRGTKRFSCPLAACGSWLATRGSQLVARGSPLAACSLQLTALLLFSIPLFISVHFYNFWPRGNRNYLRLFFRNVPVAVFHPVENVMFNGGKEHAVAPEINIASVC